ncbi:hypothetical protein OROGR_005042 [Orobanche gracilis]
MGVKQIPSKKILARRPQWLSPKKLRKARVDAVWKQMNKGVVCAETLKSMSGNKSSILNKSPQKDQVKKSSSGWMTYRGLGSKKAPSPERGQLENRPSITQYGADDDARRLAAAALSAVKDSAALASTGSGKLEGWMTYLGLGSKKAPSPGRGQLENRPSITQYGADDDARRLTAAALSAVKDSAALASTGSGKFEAFSCVGLYSCLIES